MFPTVKIIAGTGGTSQSSPGQDYVSGAVFYCPDANLPSGFSTSNRIKPFYSIADAITNGILNNYNDETAAVLEFAVTTPATSGGNIVTVNWNDPINGLLNLCTYTTKSSDTTDTILGASIAAAINVNKSLTGCSAVAASGTVKVTIRPGLGLWPTTNYSNLTAVVTGTDAGGNCVIGSVSSLSAGVASYQAVWYYHINEFFRLNPTGVLYVSFFTTPSSASLYTYAEVSTLQAFAGGIIRQVSVYAPKTYAANAAANLTFISTAVGLLQAQYTALLALKTPVQIMFATDLTEVANVSALSLDLSTFSSNRVSVVIGQDGANSGYALWLASGYSITNIGSALGTLSSAAVSDDIGDLGEYNLTNESELSVTAFATGELVKNISSTLISQLDQYRYVFYTAYPGYSGVYFNNDHCACAYTDQFAYIHFGRTWDKASRLLYVAYLPYLKAKFSLNSSGALSTTTQATLTQAGNQALDPMVQAHDLSGYAVTVPSNQNPNTTGKLAVTVQLLAMAIANEIDITSTFVASL